MPALIIIFAQVMQGVNVQYIIEPLVETPLYAACTMAFSSEWQQIQGSWYCPEFILPKWREVQRRHPPAVQCVIALGVPLYPDEIIIFSLTMMAPFLGDMQVARILTCSAIFIK